MTEHTPGQWKVENDTILDSKQNVVATRHSWRRLHGDVQDATISPTEADANAQRIVACVNGCEDINPEAVPDLLAACRAVRSAYSSHQLYDKFPLPQVEAAIAKATGEEPK